MFQKGNPGGPGRPPGKKSQIPVSDKKLLHDILIKDLLPSLNHDLSKLNASQRVSATLKLIEFFLPKLRTQYIEMESNINEETAALIIATILKKQKKDE